MRHKIPPRPFEEIKCAVGLLLKKRKRERLSAGEMDILRGLIVELREFGVRRQ